MTPNKHENFEHDVKLDVEARVRQGVKAVLEEVLEEEMTEHLRAGYRELTPTRRGERNGYYVDFGSLGAARKPVVMTQMAGVAVLVLPQVTDAGLIHRIWCDPSFGPYLWKTLQDVTRTSTSPTTGRAA